MQDATSESQSLARNPQFFQIRIILCIYSVLLFISLCAILYMIKNDNHAISLYLYVAVVVVSAGLWTFLGSVALWNFMLLRVLQKQERGRYAIAHSYVRRAIVDPPHSSFLLDLNNSSISLRLKKPYLLGGVGLICGYIALIAASVGQMFVHAGISSTKTGLIGIGELTFLALLIMLAVAGSALPTLSLRRTIEISANGLRAGIWGRRAPSHQQGWLNWEEARLFVCYSFPGILGRKGAILYELSSPESIVTWRWERHPNSPFSLWIPLRSPVEYHRQMQALHDLIIEKTGLSLINLSQPLDSQQFNSREI